MIDLYTNSEQKDIVSLDGYASWRNAQLKKFGIKTMTVHFRNFHCEHGDRSSLSLAAERETTKDEFYHLDYQNNMFKDFNSFTFATIFLNTDYTCDLSVIDLKKSDCMSKMFCSIVVSELEVVGRKIEKDYVQMLKRFEVIAKLS